MADYGKYNSENINYTIENVYNEEKTEYHKGHEDTPSMLIHNHYNQVIEVPLDDNKFIDKLREDLLLVKKYNMGCKYATTKKSFKDRVNEMVEDMKRNPLIYGLIGAFFLLLVIGKFF